MYLRTIRPVLAAIAAILATVTLTAAAPAWTAAAEPSAGSSQAASQDRNGWWGGSSADNVRVFKNLAYADAKPASSTGHLLNLYVPVTRKPAPLVIWTHGSGWLAENGRDQADVVAANLNREGYAVAGVAIRSSANAQFPGQLYDIKAAIRWLRANASQYNLDSKRFAIMGESSGGWTASMAGTTGDVRELEGDIGVQGPSSAVQAAIPIYGPTDFLQMDAHMLQNCAPFNQIFGLTGCHGDPHSPESKLLGCPIGSCPDKVKAANPITYVGRNDPPFLIMHGQQDVLVPYEQSALLQDAIAKACGTSTLITLPNGQHGQWNEFLIDPTVKDGATVVSTRNCRTGTSQPINPTWDGIVRFLNRTLR